MGVSPAAEGAFESWSLCTCLLRDRMSNKIANTSAKTPKEIPSERLVVACPLPLFVSSPFVAESSGLTGGVVIAAGSGVIGAIEFGVSVGRASSLPLLPEEDALGVAVTECATIGVVEFEATVASVGVDDSGGAEDPEVTESRRLLTRSSVDTSATALIVIE